MSGLSRSERFKLLAAAFVGGSFGSKLPFVISDGRIGTWEGWLTDGKMHHPMVLDPDDGQLTDLCPGMNRWLGLMGVELGFQEAPQAAPASAADQLWYFAPTGHTINPAFRAFWSDRGGLYTFGYPIGAAFTDGNGRLVQYFERTRLELHPEHAGSEYAVLLGLLGEELLQRTAEAR